MRHAAHALLPHTLAGRMPGVPLSAEGHAQAARLAARFAGEDLAAVVSSPVQRAMQTAAALGRPVVPDAGFEEIDFGTWTGQRFDALADDPAWDAWNRVRSFAACPDGETMHAAQSRALLALKRVHAAHPGQTVLVVSHADIIKALLAQALGLSLDSLHRFTIDPASTSTLVLWHDGTRVEGVNLPVGRV